MICLLLFPSTELKGSKRWPWGEQQASREGRTQRRKFRVWPIRLCRSKENYDGQLKQGYSVDRAYYTGSRCTLSTAYYREDYFSIHSQSELNWGQCVQVFIQRELTFSLKLWLKSYRTKGDIGITQSLMVYVHSSLSFSCLFTWCSGGWGRGSEVNMWNLFFFIFTYGGILMPMQILEMLQLCALWYFYAQNEWDLYYERNDATLPPCNTGDRSREQQGKWLNKDPIPVRKTGADQWHHVGPLYGTNRWSWAELVSFWLTLLGDALLTRPLLRGSSVINNTEGDGVTEAQRWTEKATNVHHSDRGSSQHKVNWLFSTALMLMLVSMSLLCS